jgi:hypothetical protein
LLCNSNFAEAGKKEYHFLNRLETKSGNSKIITQNSLSGINLTDSSSFDSCIRDYVSFFNDILNNSDKHHTGEITPAYAMLSTKTFLTARRVLLEYDLIPRLIFIMRNPVDRIISHFRMMVEKNSLTHFSQVSFESALLEFSLSSEASSRTKYVETLDKLSNIFDSKEVYLGFYEEIFSPDKIKELSDFLGLELDQNFGTTIVHNSRQEFEISTTVREMIFERYIDVYSSINSLFPKTKKLWVV